MQAAILLARAGWVSRHRASSHSACCRRQVHGRPV